MNPALRLQPGQQELTRAQEAEAKRFAEAFIREQLSAEPVNELEAEAWLQQAYAVAGLSSPDRVLWTDGPMPFLALLAPASVEADQREALRTRVRVSVEGILDTSRWDDPWGDSVWNLMNRPTDSEREIVRASMQAILENVVEADLASDVMQRVWPQVMVKASVGDNLFNKVWDSVGARVNGRVWDSVGDVLWDQVWSSVLYGEGNSAWARMWDMVWFPVGVMREKRKDIQKRLRDRIWDSMNAYQNADALAVSHFLDVYHAPHLLRALARFNAMVSGYWLGKDIAVLVRRPRLLVCDAEGHLHSATGKCLEFPDGWGFYAWHGVLVPEQCILHPETLTRNDFLKESNAEVRRVIQERMGQRFVPELDGVVIDSGPRGTLYEVKLPEDDPEQVARYVQVQDASLPRHYFLRVPPTIQTAAEAVAWSFQVAVEEYDPAQET